MGPSRFVIDRPAAFLRLPLEGPGPIDLDAVELAQVWALVGLAALGRANGQALIVRSSGVSTVGRFAAAVGLDDAIAGRAMSGPGEPQRTAKIRRVRTPAEADQAARDIAALLLPNVDDDESQRTIRFVLVELMRNAIQHSADPKGGVVAAQRMNAGQGGYARAMLQVAVADAGVGVLAALSATYPELPTQEAALIKALEPHVSGTFERGRTGTAENAGMGLFMVAEMAKLVGGRLLLASRGGAILLDGFVDAEGDARHRLEPVRPKGTGFPGTLVAFELPIGEVEDHAALVQAVLEKRSLRMPSGPTVPWLRFAAPPQGTPTWVVTALGEDTTAAQHLSRESLQPLLFAKKPIALDFVNVELCTQSFGHALLYEALRLSWAMQVPIFVENTTPSVEVVLRHVDAYARSG